MLQRLRDFARPLAGAPRALTGRTGAILLVVTFGLWVLEGGVYLAVARAVELDISTSGALYLVALTNFVAALPAAPGSIGTFDAAVAFGAKALGGHGAGVVSYLLLLRFILYVPITVVGLAVLVVRYGGWARVRDAARLQTSRA
ncbi:MAG: lysylphosphatidylglycerol synthase domain-containing protein [Actinomycetota bacterium]|nr:lysylphosphatidylglycerol synthase domain-containing protein [Actinomycetota bacterium]